MTRRGLDEVIEALIARRVSQINTSMPGQITQFDSSRRTATVQPMVKIREMRPDGSVVSRLRAPIQNVPVVIPKYLKLQIEAGDDVLLLFASTAIGSWIAAGGVVEPENDRQHDLDDAIAIPGLFSRASAESAPVLLEITSSQILAGGSAQLALLSDLASLKSAIAGAAVGSLDGGALFKANLLAALSSWPIGTTNLRGG